jgi:predicted 2-oxoglutarate/Fe(II)-dependent dioxygenase YbiX
VWQYNITHSNQSEFLMYDVTGKYETHVDTFHIRSDETRKLTVLVFLNEDFEGGELYYPQHDLTIKPKPGLAVAHPGDVNYLHGVTLVTKGYRYTTPSFYTVL